MGQTYRRTDGSQRCLMASSFVGGGTAVSGRARGVPRHGRRVINNTVHGVTKKPKNRQTSE